MPTSPSRYRAADVRDLDVLLALQRAFYAEAQYPFDASAMRDAWRMLLADASLGQAWVHEDETSRAQAYIVVTRGFSLEHLGRDAFIDELYVVPAARSRGLGRAALALAETWGREHGVRVLLLEVEAGNDVAHSLYTRVGFGGDARRLLKRRVS